MVDSNKSKIWNQDGAAAVFCKAKDAWGAFGNMAGGYGFTDPETGLFWKNSEAWYQAQRFPENAALREEIRAANNGFVAKQIAHASVGESRADWLEVNVAEMAKAIALKCSNEKFAAMLLATGDAEIVELSMRDAFWGAKPADNGSLRGANVLGQLLMQQRAKLQEAAPPRRRGMAGML